MWRTRIICRSAVHETGGSITSTTFLRSSYLRFEALTWQSGAYFNSPTTRVTSRARLWREEARLCVRRALVYCGSDAAHLRICKPSKGLWQGVCPVLSRLSKMMANTSSAYDGSVYLSSERPTRTSSEGSYEKMQRAERAMQQELRHRTQAFKRTRLVDFQQPRNAPG